MWVLSVNYDSFTWILHHFLQQAGGDCVVYRNDEIDVAQLEAMQPERLILSPGPETPLQAGITMAAIEKFHDRIPILGVCLGHQALGMYFGARLVHAPEPVHGKTSTITHNGHALFAGLPKKYDVMRYHSLAITDTENSGLQEIAHTADGTVMAIAHSQYRCTGVQFHPESVGTEHGLQLLRNWAAMP